MASESKNSLIFMRVDHIGSLLRPAKLQEAIMRHNDKLVSDEELGTTQDEAIRDVMAKQEAHGLPVVNDGEFRRMSFQDSFISSVSGFKFGSSTLPTRKIHSQPLPGNLRIWVPGNPRLNVSHWSITDPWKSIYLREALRKDRSK